MDPIGWSTQRIRTKGQSRGDEPFCAMSMESQPMGFISANDCTHADTLTGMTHTKGQAHTATERCTVLRRRPDAQS